MKQKKAFRDLSILYTVLLFLFIYLPTIIMMVYVVIRGRQKKKHAAKRLLDPAVKS